MIEIKEKQYDELRKHNDKYCGRVYSWKREETVFYFQMEDGDANMTPQQILKALANDHSIEEGKYDVFRHWAYPEVENVNYEES